MQTNDDSLNNLYQSLVVQKQNCFSTKKSANFSKSDIFNSTKQTISDVTSPNTNRNQESFFNHKLSTSFLKSIFNSPVRSTKCSNTNILRSEQPKVLGESDRQNSPLKLVTSKQTVTYQSQQEYGTLKLSEKDNTIKWIKELGLLQVYMKKGREPLDDNCRNGILLLNILGRVCQKDIGFYFQRPKSQEETQFNNARVFNIISELNIQIPYKLCSDGDLFIKHDDTSCLKIIDFLRKKFTDKENNHNQQRMNTQCATPIKVNDILLSNSQSKPEIITFKNFFPNNSTKNLTSQNQYPIQQPSQNHQFSVSPQSTYPQFESQLKHTNYDKSLGTYIFKETELLENKSPTELFEFDDLQYDAQQISKLEDYIIQWVNSIPSVQRIFNYIDNDRLYLQSQNGLLLKQVISFITGRAIDLHHLKPHTQAHCLANIDKSLKILRESDKIGQKFLWRTEDIYRGNKGVILGLYEDIVIFFDRRPPREGENYFFAGPYLGQSVEFVQFENSLMPTAPQNFPFRQFLSSQNSLSQNMGSPKSMDKIVGSKLRQNFSPLRTMLGTTLSTNATLQQDDLRSIQRTNQSTLINDNFLGSPIQTSTNNLQKMCLSRLLNDYQGQKDENTRVQINQTAEFEKLRGKLIIWLFKLGFTNIANQLSQEQYQSFIDGLYFVKLIEFLDQRDFQGIIKQPKTLACCFTNQKIISQFLCQISQESQSIADQLDKVVRANPDLILKILSIIHTVFINCENKIISGQRIYSPSPNANSAKKKNAKSFFDQIPEVYVLNQSERKKIIISTPKQML